MANGSSANLRIAIFSHAFYPDVGGIETMTQLLAGEFVRSGHEVTVVTRTAAMGEKTFDFGVLRRPGPVVLIRVVRDADVVFHNNPCMRYYWPLLLVRRPWVAAVRTWIRRVDGSTSFRDRLKMRLLRRATRIIAISKAVGAHLPMDSVVIPNSYRDTIFVDAGRSSRQLLRFAFVGRLVSDKGADLFVRLIGHLRRAGYEATGLIVGDGPERDRLASLAEQEAPDAISFAGRQPPEAVSDLLNDCGVLVVPSRWPEPFGIVALEGLGSGCHVMVSEEGGLGDAVGKAGVRFRNDDFDDLCRVAVQLIDDGQLRLELEGARAAHLDQHRAGRMVRDYLNVLQESVGAGKCD